MLGSLDSGVESCVNLYFFYVAFLPFKGFVCVCVCVRACMRADEYVSAALNLFLNTI